MTTVPREEILAELRELEAGARLFFLRYDLVGARNLAAADWKGLENSLDRATKFIREVDGPLVAVACCCTKFSQGASLMGLTKCPEHGTQERSPK